MVLDSRIPPIGLNNFTSVISNGLSDSLDVESSLFADDSCVFKADKNLNYIIKCIQTIQSCAISGASKFNSKNDCDGVFIVDTLLHRR